MQRHVTASAGHSYHLDTLSVNIQRLLSEIDPDRRLRVVQERAPAEAVRQARLPHARVPDDDYLEDASGRGVMTAVRRDLRGVTLTENGVQLVPRFVFYCHRSSSRGLDVSGAETSRDKTAPEPSHVPLLFPPLYVYQNDIYFNLYYMYRICFDIS